MGHVREVMEVKYDMVGLSKQSAKISIRLVVINY